MELIIKTMYNLEPVLAKELEALGATDIEELNRAVKCRGDLTLMYKANLHLRTGLKVLMPIAEGEVRDENELYQFVRSIEWSEYMALDKTFAIDGTTSGDVFPHSKYVALKSKDAIVDQFRELTEARPSVHTTDPDLRINIHIADTRCTISLDSSGMSLDRRGYRRERTTAPINEALAAGMILLSEWDMKTPFLDPMCGSGTIAIEAAMMAANRAPGLRRRFAFEWWSNFDPFLWKQLKQEAEAQVTQPTVHIQARDISWRAIDITKENARMGGVYHLIQFEKSDFLKTKAQHPSGHIVTNPPYGKRLETDDTVALYSEIGTHLKHFYPNYDAWIISSDLEAIKHVGLKASKKIGLYNGSLECKFHKFELYKGSKKVTE